MQLDLNTIVNDFWKKFWRILEYKNETSLNKLLFVLKCIIKSPNNTNWLIFIGVLVTSSCSFFYKAIMV